jgi:hypothetical protein
MWYLSTASLFWFSLNSAYGRSISLSDQLVAVVVVRVVVRAVAVAVARAVGGAVRWEQGQFSTIN